VRPGSAVSKKSAVIHQWHKSLLHDHMPTLIEKWERRLNVTVDAYHLQRMKTKWGSCNHRASSIRLNTELIKKPKDLLEYVIVHEMVHLIVPRHDGRFVALMDRHYPTWREARAELNELPLAAEAWSETRSAGRVNDDSISPDRDESGAQRHRHARLAASSRRRRN
jgi:predicted metal-dependent hydrolase